MPAFPRYYFTIDAQEVLTLYLYFCALTWYKSKKPRYVLRLILSVGVSLALCLPLALMRARFQDLPSTILNTSAIMLMVLGSLYFCYDEKPSELFLCFSGVVAAKCFSGQAFALALNLFGVDDLYSMSFFGSQNLLLDWIIYVVVHVVLLAGIYQFLRKHERLQGETSDLYAVSLAAGTFLLVGVFMSFPRHHQAESFTLSMYIKILYLVIFSSILVMRANLLFRGRISEELSIAEQMLEREKNTTRRCGKTSM